MAEPESMETELGPRRMGLVVGVDKYGDPSIPNLSGAANDASRIAALLRDPERGRFDDVRILLDEAATTESVKFHLDTFLNATRPEDTVFVFFACHGHGEYILLYNSLPASLWASALPMRDVQQVFSRIPAQKVLLALDVCFSGGAGGRTLPQPPPASTDRIEELVDAIGADAGRAILTACKADELATEDHSGGLFTQCFIEGAEGAADLINDRVIELTELYSYLGDVVPNRTGGRQHPLLKANLQGSFPLFVVPEAPPEATVLSFIGIHGGVGKSTFVNRGADLIARTIPGARVLLVDLDLETMQTTQLRGGGDVSCRTMLEYFRDPSVEFDAAMDVTRTVGRSDPIAQRNPLKETFAGTGRVYLLPANKADVPDFDVIKQIQPEELLRRLREIVLQAVQKYDISHVLVDCEAKVNYPPTAAAAFMSKHLFVIGFNQPTSWEGRGRYRSSIKSLLPDFAPEKVHLVLNQVPRRTQVPIDVFATVPDVGEFGHMEDTMNPFTMRDVLLDQFLLEIFVKALELEPEEVRADTVIPEEWQQVVAQAPLLEQRRSLRFYRAISRFRIVKVLVIVLTSVLTLGIAIPWWTRRARLTATLRNLRQGGDEWIKRSLVEASPDRRNSLDELVGWSRKVLAKEVGT